eukprot:Lankesteria_metandrocarpae@DN575_c0_g1_i2.p1
MIVVNEEDGGGSSGSTPISAVHILDSTKLLEALNVYHSDDVRHHSDDVRGVRDDANSCSQLKWHSSGDDQALSDDYDRRACDGDGTYNSYYSSDDGLAEYDIVIPNHELRQNSRVVRIPPLFNSWCICASRCAYFVFPLVCMCSLICMN